MAHPMRRRPPQGHVFYSTALVISLFAVYSLIRSIDDGKQQRHGRNTLSERSLEPRDQQCRFVHNAADQCAFVMRNCPDEEAGLISYLQLYYCSLANAKPVAFIILVVWISALFSTIGIAASDFLCINLSTIAAILGMSESLTGVTFLAFGNGSPDVFSTFAAMSSNSGSLAVGELMGAAGFITAVVAGSMAIVKPFNVARRSFVRDVGFFAVAASFSLVFLIDGNLRLWECATMVGFYVFYVVFVVTWHWYIGRRRKRRLQEAAARLLHHIPNTQELEAPDLGHDDEEARPASERTSVHRASSGETLPLLETPETPAWRLEEIDDDNEARDRYLAELQSNMRVARPSRGARRNTMTPIRPSLIGALEFRAVLSSLERRSTQASNINLRRYSDDPVAGHNLAHASLSYPALSTVNSSDDESQDNGRATRNRAVSANDAVGLRIDTSLLDVPSTVPETAVYSSGPSPVESPGPSDHHRHDSGAPQQPHQLFQGASPQFVLSPAGELDEPVSTNHGRQSSGDLLAPPVSYFHRPNYVSEAYQEIRSPVLSPKMAGIPTLQVPHPDHNRLRSSSSTSFPAYTDSPAVLTPASSRAPSIRLPAPSLSPESGGNLSYDDSDEETFRTFKWWPYPYLPAPQIIASTLFPTIYGWRQKGILDKMLGLVTAPSVFLLTITLPVVEANSDGNQPDPDPGLLTPEISGRRRTNTHVHLPADSPYLQGKSTPGDPPPHPHHSALSRQDSFKTPTMDVQETSSAKDWNRWLVFVQIFTAPLFTTFIVWANMDEQHSMHVLTLSTMGSLVFSLIILLVLLATTSPDQPPSYRPLFCFLGFAVAIAWISTIANEVVGVLKAIGVILGISDAILGLTIFAVGNSLGDLVADITVARLGYPVMALSACFGGPMLNILLGIGISGLYMTIRNGTHHHHQHPDKPIRYKPYEVEVGTTLIISGVTLLITLVGLLIVVPLNGWKLDRKIGWGLIALWCLSTIGNVIVEVIGPDGI